MMSAQEKELRREFVEHGASLYERGYATGAAGNMSLMLPDGNVIATPTGSCLGRLDPDNLSKVDINGNLLEGPKATKEAKFHLAIYRGNPGVKAIVHLHSTYSTALSCLDNLNKANVFKAFTPYVVMRMGEIPLIPYYKPGSDKLVEDVEKLAPDHIAFLLANHGPVAGGKDLVTAVNNVEEFEATAKLFFTLQSKADHIRYLTDAEVNELR